MSSKVHKINGRPYDVIVFDICPRDAAGQFMLDEDFQRKVREGTPMIAGIQKTLEGTRTLRCPIHIYRSGGDPPFVVVDGKHRIYSLMTLESNIRCTIDAFCHNVASKDDAVRLFEELNKTVPPSISHFFMLHADRGSETVELLYDLLPFSFRITGQRTARPRPTPGCPTINQIMSMISKAFDGFDRVNRFNMEESLGAVAEEHVELLAEFARIYEDSAGPINRHSPRYANGWFEVLFRIWVQNTGIGLDAQAWRERFIHMFTKDHRSARHIETPKVALGKRHTRKHILDALSMDKKPKVKFDTVREPAAHVALERWTADAAPDATEPTDHQSGHPRWRSDRRKQGKAS